MHRQKKKKKKRKTANKRRHRMAKANRSQRTVYVKRGSAREKERE